MTRLKTDAKPLRPDSLGAKLAAAAVKGPKHLQTVRCARIACIPGDHFSQGRAYWQIVSWRKQAARCLCKEERVADMVFWQNRHVGSCVSAILTNDPAHSQWGLLSRPSFFSRASFASNSHSSVNVERVEDVWLCSAEQSQLVPKKKRTLSNCDVHMLPGTFDYRFRARLIGLI